MMGEFHYARYPREYWEESLLKMKAAKVSIVAAYVFWIHHGEIEGEWNWSGDRALRELAVLCARHDLYLFLRIGPWVHGECRNGGFPDWLPQRGPVLRDDYPVYLDYVEKFYTRFTGRLKATSSKTEAPSSASN